MKKMQLREINSEKDKEKERDGEIVCVCVCVREEGSE